MTYNLVRIVSNGKLIVSTIMAAIDPDIKCIEIYLLKFSSSIISIFKNLQIFFICDKKTKIYI